MIDVRMMTYDEIIWT